MSTRSSKKKGQTQVAELRLLVLCLAFQFGSDAANVVLVLLHR